MSEGGQKVQISSYKISHGDVTYSMVTIVNNTVWHIWKWLKVKILKVLITRKKIVTMYGVTNVIMVLQMLIRLNVMIILQ